MIDWIKRKTRHLIRALSPDGVLIVSDPSVLTDTSSQLTTPLPSKDVEALLHQLEDDGYALPRADGYSISWNAIYDLLQHQDYGPSLALLQIPTVSTFSPVLESRNSLTDPAFCISIAAWRDENGRRIGSLQLTGPLVRREDEVNLLPQAVWQLAQRVSAFSMRDQSHRNAEAHRCAWGEIRRLAFVAKAQLDDFFFELSS
jgi:hypothetical protein